MKRTVINKQVKKLLLNIVRKETRIRNKHVIYLAYCLLVFKICKSGIWFFYRGDYILWLWPWRRAGFKYVSLLLSGTGEFGDARYNSLKEMNKVWEEYFKACASIPNEPVEI